MFKIGVWSSGGLVQSRVSIEPSGRAVQLDRAHIGKGGCMGVEREDVHRYIEGSTPRP